MLYHITCIGWRTILSPAWDHTSAANQPATGGLTSSHLLDSQTGLSSQLFSFLQSLIEPVLMHDNLNMIP